jgi:hypothetical protein
LFIVSFKYLDSLSTNKNSTREEIKCRLKAGSACYYSVKTLLNSQHLSKNLKIKMYETMIYQVVLHGCETWSLILMEECRVRVFENRILRRIFVLYRDANRKWRRLHNGELDSLYRSPNIFKVIKSRRLIWEVNVIGMEESRGSFKISRPKRGKKPLGKSRCRWVDNIIINVSKT